MNEFQPQLGELVKEFKPEIAVETGFQTGVSTQYILDAMDKNGFGKLYSIDPFAKPAFVHPRLEFVWGFSYEKMSEIFLKSGPWDLFLHDSDHSVGCMAFELELAWRYCKPEAIIACDDYTWGIPEHKAWQNFLKRHDYAIPYQLGSAQYIFKGESGGFPVRDEQWAKNSWSEAAVISNKACEDYGKKKYFPNL